MDGCLTQKELTYKLLRQWLQTYYATDLQDQRQAVLCPARLPVLSLHLQKDSEEQVSCVVDGCSV